MRVLVVNAGSSSVKLRLLADDDSLAGSVDLPAEEGKVDEGELAPRLSELGPADAIGHRVVHGGTRSITSITRWKRSRSFSITMSNGVVVVPSSV